MTLARHYETLWIAPGSLSQEEVDTLVTEMEGLVRDGDGKLLNVEKQGKRRLAYPIKKSQEGYYTLFEMEATPEAVGEMERRMRLHDQVLRYMTVNIGEEGKRASKLSAKRSAQKAKRAAKKGEDPGEASESE